jgi:hypothetical protein
MLISQRINIIGCNLNVWLERKITLLGYKVISTKLKDVKIKKKSKNTIAIQ